MSARVIAIYRVALLSEQTQVENGVVEYPQDLLCLTFHPEKGYALVGSIPDRRIKGGTGGKSAQDLENLRNFIHTSKLYQILETWGDA